MRRILISLLSLFFTTPLLGNEFVVKSFNKIDNDLSARRYERKDINEISCAIIKIRTNIPGPFVIVANLGIVGDVDYKDGGEMWIWVSEGERRISIAKEDFIKINYDLPKRIEGPAVYDIVLSAKENKIPVVIQSVPGDAEKWIDGQLIGTGEKFNVEMGERRLRIAKEGFFNKDTIINITKDNYFFKIPELIEFHSLPITIKTKPTGARVFIRNKEYNSPINEELWPGKYPISITKYGYFNMVDTLDIYNDKPNDFQYVLEKNQGEISIQVFPEQSDIAINGRKVENNSVSFYEPGRYIIKIQKEFYFSIEDTLDIKRNDKIIKRYDLKENFGTVSFEYIPRTTTVTQNSTLLQNNTEFLFLPGKYIIKLEAPDFETKWDTISLNIGDNIVINDTLTPLYGDITVSSDISDIIHTLHDNNDNLYKQWKGDNELREIPAGNYSLISQKSEYQTNIIDMYIKPGSHRKYNIQLVIGSDISDSFRERSWGGLSFVGVKFRGSKELKYHLTDFYVLDEKLKYKIFKNTNEDDKEKIYNTTWFKAIARCNILSDSAGFEPAYELEGTFTDSLGNVRFIRKVVWNKNADGYRLPTSTEYDYMQKYFNGYNKIKNDAGYEWCWDGYRKIKFPRIFKRSDPAGRHFGMRYQVDGDFKLVQESRKKDAGIRFVRNEKKYGKQNVKETAIFRNFASYYLGKVEVLNNFNKMPDTYYEFGMDFSEDIYGFGGGISGMWTYYALPSDISQLGIIDTSHVFRDLSWTISGLIYLKNIHQLSNHLYVDIPYGLSMFVYHKETINRTTSDTSRYEDAWTPGLYLGIRPEIDINPFSISFEYGTFWMWDWFGIKRYPNFLFTRKIMISYRFRALL